MARSDIKKIVYTRLPVGHTHEDIDAKFGNIWKGVRMENLLTPQAYKRHLEEIIFRNSDIPFKVVDVFVVPDYKSFLSSSIDKDFQGWTKGERTQLQWMFDRPPEDSAHYFPNGVRVQYRAYCSGEVVEVRPIGDIPSSYVTEAGLAIGYQAVNTIVSWHPQPRPAKPRGMFLLTSLPEPNY